MIPGCFLFGACGLVLLEKHLSGTVIIALIGLFVMFISGTNLKRMILSYDTDSGNVPFLKGALMGGFHENISRIGIL